MSAPEQKEEEFSLKQYFVPLTTTRAIHFIIIIGLIVYFNSLFNGFAGDDNGQIINNSAVHSVNNILGFFKVSTFDLGNGVSGMYYKPLLLLIYSLIYAISGSNAFFFHFFQVLIHIANAVLVFILFKKFINKEFAFLLSSIFLIHPINQDSVVYISNLQDTTFLFFGLLAILFTMEKKIKYRNIWLYLMLLFSLLCKETGIIFLFINIVYIFLFRKDQFKKTILYSSIIVVIYSIIHTSVVGTNFVTEHIYHIGRLPLLERLINIPKIIYYYLFTFSYPNSLAVSYDWVVKSPNFSDFYLPLLVVLLFFGILFFFGKMLHKKHDLFKVYIFFVVWFILGLIPHMQIIPLDGTVAARWFYLPIIGLLGIFGIFLQNFLKSKNIKTVFILFSLLIIALFSIRTFMRNIDFKDNLTLMCHDADVSHDNFALENSCGISLLSVGSLDKAQKYFEKSVALAPYYGTNYWGMGVVLASKAELQKSIVLYNKSVIALKTAIQKTPLVPRAYESLGYLYAHYEDTQTAKNFLVSSLKLFPNSYTLWLNYAYVEYKAGDSKTALQAITNAYTLNPNDPLTAEYYYNLSNNLPIKIEQIKFDPIK